MEENQNFPNGEGAAPEIVTRQNGFDPMTGQPVYETLKRTGYDPVTGQPVYQRVIQQGYDPMTGKPNYVPYAGTPQAASGQGMTGQPAAGQAAPGQGVQGVYPGAGTGTYPSQDAYGNRKKLRLPLMIAVIAVVVLALGGTAFGMVRSGVFLEKHEKVLRAAKATLESDHLIGVFYDAADYMDGDSYTVNADWNVSAEGQNVSGDMKLLGDNRAFAYSMEGTAAYSGFSTKAQLYMDKDTLQAFIPALSGSVLEVNFDQATGYLNDALLEETDGTVSMQDVAEIMEECAELAKQNKQYQRDLKKAIKSSFREMQLREIGKRSFSVAGGTHDLKGYELTVTKQDLVRFMESIQEVTDKYQPQKVYQLLSELSGESVTPAEMYRELLDELNGISDFSESVKLYLYKGKLAAVTYENAEGYAVEMTMQGSGDAILSSFEISITYRDTELATVYRRSEYHAGLESGTLGASYSGVSYEAAYSYDTGSGDFRLTIPYGTQSYVVNGTFLAEKNRTKLALDTSIEGVGVTLDMEMTAGARVNRLTGDVLDLGMASEEELEQIVSDMSQSLGNLGLGGMGGSSADGDFEDFEDYLNGAW